VLGGGILVCLALVAVVGWRRRNGAGTAVSTAGQKPSDAERAESDTGGETEIAAVRTRLGGMDEASPEALVRASYHTLRELLERRSDVSAVATHWELYRDVVADQPSVEEDLRVVVETYEHVMFADQTVDLEVAESARDAALAVAKPITDSGDPTSEAAPPDSASDDGAAGIEE